MGSRLGNLFVAHRLVACRGEAKATSRGRVGELSLKWQHMPRAVAQLGSALDWGSRGRRFKSCQPDKFVFTAHAGNRCDPRLFGGTTVPFSRRPFLPLTVHSLEKGSVSRFFRWSHFPDALVRYVLHYVIRIRCGLELPRCLHGREARSDTRARQ